MSAAAIKQRTTANAQLLVFSIGASSKLIDHLKKIERQINQFAGGLKALLRGRLSPNLISETVMSKTIEDLQEKIEAEIQCFPLN